MELGIGGTAGIFGIGVVFGLFIEYRAGVVLMLRYRVKDFTEWVDSKVKKLFGGK